MISQFVKKLVDWHKRQTSTFPVVHTDANTFKQDQSSEPEKKTTVGYTGDDVREGNQEPTQFSRQRVHQLLERCNLVDPPPKKSKDPSP